MIPCILILTLSGDCLKRDGECVCLTPAELAAEIERPDIWDRLLAAVEQAKERTND